MPCDDLIQRSPKGGLVQFSPQLETVQVLIRLTTTFYLRQKPQPLLRKRQRQTPSRFAPGVAPDADNWPSARALVPDPPIGRAILELFIAWPCAVLCHKEKNTWGPFKSGTW